MSTEPTVLQQLIVLLTSHGWLGAIALVVVYLRKILSPASGFPVTIPPKWLPVVSSGGGVVWGAVLALQTGATPVVVVVGAVVGLGVGGTLDALMVAVFDHDNAPKWLRAIVFVFDDVTKTAPSGTKSKEQRLPGGKAFGTPPSIPPPAA